MEAIWEWVANVIAACLMGGLVALFGGPPWAVLMMVAIMVRLFWISDRVKR